MFMAINFQSIADLNKVTIKEGAGLKDLTLNMAFSLVFTIIYGSAFIALFVVL